MKTKVITGICTLILLLLSYNGMGQETAQKTKLAVLNIDARGVNSDATTMGNMARIEMEKLGLYDVLDKYDVIQFMEQNRVSMTNCFGKTCLTEMGLLLKSDKMFSGSVEQMGRFILVTYRLLDVKTSSVEKTYVHEFLYLPEELQNMVKLSIADMFGQPFDGNLMSKLSKKFDYDNLNNNPTIERLRLDGPRMGFTSFTGDLLTRIMAPKEKGGFDAFPMMFQFGYQFEKQYLNEGKAQALFEFIPMVTGLDQGYFIPSAAVLHGLRSNVNGWEFAFGPTFQIIPIAKGYFDENNEWQLRSHWNADGRNEGIENPHKIEERIDSRGYYTIKSSFVLAVGRTFKSGKLNIPVNMFVIPGKNGWRYGISMGFNAKNKSVHPHPL